MKKKILNVFGVFEIIIFLIIIVLEIPYILAVHYGNATLVKHKAFSLITNAGMVIMFELFFILAIVLLDLGIIKSSFFNNKIESRIKYFLSKHNKKKEKIFLKRIVLKISIFLIGILLYYFLFFKIKSLRVGFFNNEYFTLNWEKQLIAKDWFKYFDKEYFWFIVINIVFISDIVVDSIIFVRKKREIKES